MNETRDRILDLAERFIRTRGFNAFSYRDISIPLGIRNAAVHYHFPTKTDLGIAVVARAIDDFRQSASEWNLHPEYDRVQKFAEFYMESNREGMICLVGSLSADFDTLPEPLQRKVREMADGILDWLAETLADGRKAETLRFEGSPRERALAVVSGFLSSLLLGRMMKGNVFEQVIERTIADLRA